MDDKNSGRSKPAGSDKKRRGDRLGDQLRRIYDDVTKESVPDDFLRLLEEAERARPASKSGNDAAD